MQMAQTMQQYLPQASPQWPPQGSVMYPELMASNGQSFYYPSPVQYDPQQRGMPAATYTPSAPTFPDSDVTVAPTTGKTPEKAVSINDVPNDDDTPVTQPAEVPASSALFRYRPPTQRVARTIGSIHSAMLIFKAFMLVIIISLSAAIAVKYDIGKTASSSATRVERLGVTTVVFGFITAALTMIALCVGYMTVCAFRSDFDSISPFSKLCVIADLILAAAYLVAGIIAGTLAAYDACYSAVVLCIMYLLPGVIAQLGTTIVTFGWLYVELPLRWPIKVPDQAPTN